MSYHSKTEIHFFQRGPICIHENVEHVKYFDADFKRLQRADLLEATGSATLHMLGIIIFYLQRILPHFVLRSNERLREHGPGSNTVPQKEAKSMPISRVKRWSSHLPRPRVQIPPGWIISLQIVLIPTY
jgi:hypothetical protein